MGQTQWVMATGVNPHYTTVFIKLGIRLLCLSERTAHSGYVRPLVRGISQQLFTICGVGTDSPLSHNKYSILSGDLLAWINLEIEPPLLYLLTKGNMFHLQYVNAILPNRNRSGILHLQWNHYSTVASIVLKLCTWHTKSEKIQATLTAYTRKSRHFLHILWLCHHTIAQILVVLKP